MDLCRRRRNRLETCLKNKEMREKNTVFDSSAVELEKKRCIVREFPKTTRTYEYRSSTEEQ